MSDQQGGRPQLQQPGVQIYVLLTCVALTMVTSHNLLTDRRLRQTGVKYGSQVSDLGGLSFASAGRASRRAAQEHAQGLAQGNVADVCQGCDH